MEKITDQSWKINYDLRTILEQIDSNKTFKDNENFILDWKFDTTKDYVWSEINQQLKMIPGKKK